MPLRRQRLPAHHARALNPRPPAALLLDGFVVGAPSTWSRGITRAVPAAASPVGRWIAAATILVFGWVLTTAVLAPIGVAARAHRPGIDRTVYDWVRPRVHDGALRTAINTLNSMTSRDATAFIALVSLLVLALAYGRRWYVPTFAILTAVAMQRAGEDVLNRVVGHPARSVPGADVFLSGGVSRLIAVYGIVIALSLALLPATQRRIWRSRCWIGLAVFGAAEAYAGVYLSANRLTAVLCGLLFGCLLLLAEVTALHVLDPPTVRPVPSTVPAQHAGTPATDPAAPTLFEVGPIELTRPPPRITTRSGRHRHSQHERSDQPPRSR